ITDDCGATSDDEHRGRAGGISGVARRIDDLAIYERRIAIPTTSITRGAPASTLRHVPARIPAPGPDDRHGADRLAQPGWRRMDPADGVRGRMARGRVAIGTGRSGSRVDGAALRGFGGRNAP